jgi:hypothetical protein
MYMKGFIHILFGCPESCIQSIEDRIECRGCHAMWWRDAQSGKWVNHLERDYKESC